MKNKVIYIVSASYPFGKGEDFLSKELNELSCYFSKIYLFPLSMDDNKRWLPDNVELDLTLAKSSRIVSISSYFKNAYFLCKVILIELLNTNLRKIFLVEFRNLLNTLLQVKMLSRKFQDKIDYSQDNYFYSVWMDDGALLFAILKDKGLIDKFVIRLHGYDLFDERRKGNYMPFRYYIFKHSQKVFVLSRAGYDYLLNKKIFPSKIIQNYSGLYENGTNPFNKEQIFTIVSCSNVIDIKRIDKIIDTLKNLNFPVKWYHFGDGNQMEQIKKMATILPHNISYEFKGSVANEEILNFYCSESVNLFLHLSDSEGLGMAIVEAQSFGIPALAVNVGGVSEVVNEKTGVLVDKNDSCDLIAQKIKEIRLGEINTFEFRKGVKLFWQEKFNAKKNYKIFFENIIN